MKNNVEIEAKIKVDSLEEVQHKITGFNSSKFIGRQIHVDYYFQCVKDITKWVRIRTQIVDGKGTMFLTFKGAKEESHFKKRIELEVELKIGEFQTLYKMLTALGFKPNSILEKTRRLWRFNGCDICLDDITSLGYFVEIEGPDEGLITAVQESLGLGNEPIIKDGYRTLLDHKDKTEK